MAGARYYYLIPINIQIASGNTAPATFWRYAQHKVKDERNTTFNLTQEFLAQTLAVRRPGVTVAMASLAKKNLISYRFRQVTLLDMPGLKETACECYATIRERAGELLA